MDRQILEKNFENVVNYVAANRYRRCLKLKGRDPQGMPVFQFSYSRCLDDPLPLPAKGKDIRIILPNGDLIGLNHSQQDILELANEVIANNEQWASLSHFLEITYEEAPAFLVVNCSCLVINPNQQVVYKSAFSTAFTDYRSKFWLYAVLFGKKYFPFVQRVEWFTAPTYLPEAPNVLSEFSKKMMAK